MFVESTFLSVAFCNANPGAHLDTLLAVPSASRLEPSRYAIPDQIWTWIAMPNASKNVHIDRQGCLYVGIKFEQVCTPSVILHLCHAGITIYHQRAAPGHTSNAWLAETRAMLVKH